MSLMQQTNMEMAQNSVFNLGDLVKKRRLELEYSIRDLEEKSGISYSCLRALEERKLANITVYTMVAISNALDGIDWKIPLIEK